MPSAVYALAGEQGEPTLATMATTAFAQILGKLYFFNLPENLRRIVLDYEPKCSRSANAAFKGAC
jgi:hypothetical protein